MAESVNIGTVSAFAKLDITGLRAGILQSQQAMQGMVASMQKDLKAIEANTAQSLANNKKAINDHAMAWQSAAKSISHDLLIMGAGVTGAFGLAIKAGSDFQKTLNDVRSNTTMTAADAKIMEDAVKDLGSHSSAPLKELADGFMHITNFGFAAADSQKILNEAMRSAVSTGGNTEHTANILAAVMHEFGIKTNDAAKAMNTLHVASALGNMTLEQFNQAAGPTLAYAAGLGMKLPDVAAAMTALTRHGFDAAEAATQVRNELSHIASPSEKAKQALEELSKASGVNLVHDFSVAGLSTKGLYGVISDLRLAAQRTQKDFGTLAIQTGLLSKETLSAFSEAERKSKAEMISLGEATKDLIPAQRGMIGTLVLAGVGFKDLEEAAKKLGMTMSGELDRTTADYERTTKLTAFQVGVLKNNLVLLADDIAKTLGPAVNDLVADFGNLLRAFRDQTSEAKDAEIKYVAVAGAVALITGAVISLVIKLSELKAALVTLGVTGPAAFTALAAAASAFFTIKGLEQSPERAKYLIDKEKRDYLEHAKTLGPAAYAEAQRRMSVEDDARARQGMAEGRLATTAQLRANAPRSIFDLFPPSKMGASGRYKGSGEDKDADERKKRIQEIRADLIESEFGENAKAQYMAAIHKMEDAKLVGSKMAEQEYETEIEKIIDKMIQKRHEMTAEAMKREADKAQKNRELNFQQWDMLLGRESGQAVAKSELTEQQKDSAKEFAEAWARELSTDITNALNLPGFDPLEGMLNKAEEDILKTAGPDYAGMDREAQGERNLALQQRITEEMRKQADASRATMQAWKPIQDALTRGFEHAFTDMFKKGLKGFKSFFQDILQSFEQMLVKMAAEWAAQQIIFSAIKIAAFAGFDDPKNDAMAFRWGSDFGKQFTRGAYEGTRVTAASPGGSNMVQHFSFSFPGDIHVREEADINRIADRLAWNMKQRTKVRVGS